MWLPIFAHGPVEALIAIEDTRLQALETVRHFPADAGLNMLVALRFGQTASVNENSEGCLWGRDSRYLSN